jgi:hypothetical protein
VVGAFDLGAGPVAFHDTGVGAVATYRVEPAEQGLDGSSPERLRVLRGKNRPGGRGSGG